MVWIQGLVEFQIKDFIDNLISFFKNFVLKIVFA